MKKKNILLKSAIGVGSIAAISTAAIATTSCGNSQVPHIDAYAKETLTANTQSTANICVTAVGVTLPSDGTVVQQEGLPTDIAATWKEGGYILLSGKHEKAETIEFTITVDEVSTKTSVTVAPYSADPVIKIQHETLDIEKLYFDNDYQAGVNGCYRYEYEPNPGPSEDWLVEYDIVDFNKNNYVYGNFIRFEYLRESNTDYDMVIYGLSQEEFEVGKDEIKELLSDTEVDITDSVWQQLLKGDEVVINGIYNTTFYIQFKILDNFFLFSNELASFTATPSVLGKDLTELTKDEIKNLPIGTKFVFNFDFYLSDFVSKIRFGEATNSTGDADGFRIIVSGGGDDYVAICDYRQEPYPDQRNYADAGGQYEYVYGSNGENWNDDYFVLQKRIAPDKEDFEDIEKVPEEFTGFCRVYLPTDEGYFESETGIALTDGYLNWVDGINAEDNEIKSIHFNWDSYFSRFQHKGTASPINNYFIRYEIDSDNYLDFYWNLNKNEDKLVYSVGNYSMRVHLPDFSQYDGGDNTIYNFTITDRNTLGGHYNYTLGDWGEPTNGTFRIMQYVSYTSESEFEVSPVTDPDWSGESWTGDGKSSSAFDSGFVTLVK